MSSVQYVFVSHTACYFCDSRMSKIQYRTASGGCKCIGIGLRIETRTEGATIVDIFHTVQTVRNTGIHLRVDEGQWRIVQGSKRQSGGSWPLAAVARLFHPDNPFQNMPVYS